MPRRIRAKMRSSRGQQLTLLRLYAGLAVEQRVEILDKRRIEMQECGVEIVVELVEFALVGFRRGVLLAQLGNAPVDQHAAHMAARTHYLVDILRTHREEYTYILLLHLIGLRQLVVQRQQFLVETLQVVVRLVEFGVGFVEFGIRLLQLQPRDIELAVLAAEKEQTAERQQKEYADRQEYYVVQHVHTLLTVHVRLFDTVHHGHVLAMAAATN